MRGRDLVLLGAVLLVGGFAVIDALRDGDKGSSPETETFVLPPLPPPPGPQPQREAPDEYPRGVLRGRLVVADVEDCRIRVLDLAGGRERPVTRRPSNCEVWPAPGGGMLAYGLDDDRFVLTDLSQSLARGDLGTFTERIGPVLWRPDASRIAWCGRQPPGFELRIPKLLPRHLERCPIAYTGTGQLAFVVGNRLIARGRAILRTSGAIGHASWGNDGSIGLYLDNGRFERWQGDRRDDAVEIPGRFGDPVFAPDNCAALFQDVDQARFEVFALDCFEAERPDLLIFGGTAVAWSPDGRWIAVAYADRIGFHRVATGEEVASWPVRAAALAWTAD